MPRRQNVLRRPIDYIESGAWPSAAVEPFLPALLAQAFARNLIAATAGRSTREVARRAELNHVTIANLRGGEAWPDTVTVAKLEASLGILLWPKDIERLWLIRRVRDGRWPADDGPQRLAEILSAMEDVETAMGLFRADFPDQVELLPDWPQR